MAKAPFIAKAPVAKASAAKASVAKAPVAKAPFIAKAPFTAKAPSIAKAPPTTKASPTTKAPRPDAASNSATAPTPIAISPTPSEPSQARHDAKRRRRWRLLVPTLVIAPVVAAGAVLLAVQNESHAPATAAESWIVENAGADQRLVVPEATAVDLKMAGFSGGDLVTYAQLRNWRDADWVMTSTAPSTGSDSTAVATAVSNSIPVAVFGSGDQRVEVRKVTDQGAVLAAAEQAQGAETRARVGAQLAENPALRISEANRSLLADGRVDPRIAIVLATILADGSVTVAGFPVVAGEQAGPLRQVEIAGIPDSSRSLIDNLSGPYAPSRLTEAGKSIVLTYAPAIDPLGE